MHANPQKLPQSIINTLEILRGMSQSAKKESFFTSGEASDQETKQKPYEREIRPGETINISELKHSETIIESIEPNRHTYLLEEERVFVERRTSELKEQIEILKVEVQRLAEVTPNLTAPTEMSVSKSTNSGNLYDNFILEILKDIVSFIKSFRESAEADRSLYWHSSHKKRVNRKGGQWASNVRQYGASYLMSGEHYNSRSAA